MWACGIGTMKTEKISLKIFVRNSTKKKKKQYTQNMSLWWRTVIRWLGKKTVKSQPGNEDLSWGIFMLFGVKEKKRFLSPKSVRRRSVFFLARILGCRLFIEITSVVCLPRPIPVATNRKKHTYSYTMQIGCVKIWIHITHIIHICIV